ncbi:superfamily II DNA/RNA helicase [Stackebrandtia albiflava]|uniref:RNA helicase n=1 Tax=Stackebrandtia albiflava TaxID=406432 RepID=A0A562V4S8_9ACTN|nr:superfamily II DNA/RNA helicase [Stackebrandtia albiflava]
MHADSPSFSDLGVRTETVEALAAIGITQAFAIQEYAIPIAMRGNDIIGRAPTGTGKTLGFGVPILERVVSAREGADGRPQALVVVPTRELGLQVCRDIEAAGKTRDIRVLPVYGGRAYEPQVEALKSGVDIVVGTPGRLLDLLKSKKLRLDGVHTAVLDEADRMLDLGFAEDVEKLLNSLPEQRQTMLFSATMPDPIVALSRRFLRQPMTIHAETAADAGLSAQTRQLAYLTHSLNKIEVLARILQADGRGLTIVFSRTKRHTQRIADELEFRGFAVAAVHGDLGQNARERALRAFRSGKVDVLVATDVAARGLDVHDVTHVVNYDSPEDSETYVHRIGRTGRAGATGVAVTFVSWEDIPRWKIISKTLDLDLADPQETYHTSDHLYSDLGIPEGAPAALPSAERTRAGLSAEADIDIEGAGKPRRRRGGGRRGGGQGQGEPEPQASAAAKAPRQRRRTRSGAGKPDATAPAPRTKAPEAGDSPSQAGGGQPRRRRRRRPARGDEG